MSADGFTTQWAIRLPNGELMSYQPACTNAHFIFGAEPPARKPYVYDDHTEAMAAMERAQKFATELGVTWMGRIEQRTCSPFSLTDPSEGLADEVDRWVERQGGEQ